MKVKLKLGSFRIYVLTVADLVSLFQFQVIVYTNKKIYCIMCIAFNKNTINKYKICLQKYNLKLSVLHLLYNCIL